MLRAAVIGLGHRTAAVLRALQAAGGDVSVSAYADPQPHGLEAARAVCPVGPAAADAPALLGGGPYDLVLVGSPNHLHAEHLAAALDAGFPVFMEKPVVRTEAESVALARRLARPHPPLFAGLVLRSMPIVREALGLVRSGALGEIVSMDATEHLPAEHGAYLARNWRRKAAFGGSFLLDKACHDFDCFAAIAGARPAFAASFGGRRVFTAARTPRRRAWSDGTPAFSVWPGGWDAAPDAFGSDMDVADHQTALVEYANGVRVSFHANSATSLRERRWYVAGTEGTLIADLSRNTLLYRPALSLEKPQRWSWPVDGAHNGADEAMAADLLAALRRGAPYPVTPMQALEAGLAVMAVDRAMAERRVVECGPMFAALDGAG